MNHVNTPAESFCFSLESRQSVTEIAVGLFNWPRQIIGQVKSLPKKCLSSGKIRKNPGHSSVTKLHFLLSTLFINSLSDSSVRSPMCQDKARFETPQMARHSQVLFFSIDKMPDFIPEDRGNGLSLARAVRLRLRESTWPPLA